MPKDPVILLSFLNTQLRDHYATLDDLCCAFNVSKEEIIKKMKGIHYEYDPKINAFH